MTLCFCIMQDESVAGPRFFALHSSLGDRTGSHYVSRGRKQIYAGAEMARHLIWELLPSPLRARFRLNVQHYLFPFLYKRFVLIVSR